MIWIALGIAGTYGTIVLLAWSFQHRMVWFPGGRGADPSAVGLPFEEAVLRTSDGLRLTGWFVPGPAGAGAVLVSNGNAGSISGRLALAQAFHEMGQSVLLYDYRGYGGNPGTPTEEGTYRDAEAAWDWLKARGFAPGQITLYGESLGGAVSVALATRRQAARLIVENTFTSLPDAGARAYPWLPVRWLSRIRYDSRARAAGISIPVMVIVSPDDEIVPAALGRQLAAAFPVPATVLETGGAHNSGGFRQRLEWRAAVARFIAGEK